MKNTKKTMNSYSSIINLTQGKSVDPQNYSGIDYGSYGGGGSNMPGELTAGMRQEEG